MKHTLRLFAFAALFGCLAVQETRAQELHGTMYNIDTLESFVAGPSSEYFAIRLTQGNERLDAYILRINVTNPLISFEAHLGKGQLVGTETPSSMAQRNTTDTKIGFGATNGDFFITVGEVGRPVGLTIGNDEYALIGDTWRNCAGLNTEGRPQISLHDRWSYSGVIVKETDSLSLVRVNHYRDDNELMLFNQHQGASTGTEDGGSEAILSLLPGEKWQTNGKMKLLVEAVNVGIGNTAIEKGKAVLSGSGDKKAFVDGLKVGDEVEILFALTMDGEPANMSQVIGGDNYALILDNGIVPADSEIWNERHPRTAFGHSMTGDTVIMCVVDGRGKSSGCNTAMVGAIMKHYGAWRANNWDGGGSSCMYLQKFGQVNVPSDGHERATSGAMVAFANLPEVDNEIATIRPYAPTLFLPKYGMHKPKFLGYNKYDVLLDTDVQGVTLEADGTTGYIKDGQYVCLADGSFIANYNGITTTVNVRVKDGAEIQMRLDSVLVSDDTDYSIEVIGIAGKSEVILLPSSLTWVVEDPTVCSVSEQGILNGLQDGGRTLVFGTLGEYTDTLIVNVEIPESKPTLLTNMSNAEEVFTVKTTPSSLKTEFRAGENGQGIFWTNFTGGRAANTKFAFEKCFYSLPRFVEVRYTTEAFPITKIAFEFQANNTIEKMNYTIDTASLVLNGPTSIMLDMDAILGVKSDIAIYPITWHYMTFFYDLKAEKKEYTMNFDGIYLHYGPISVGVDNVTMPSFSVYPNPVIDDVLTITDATAETAYLYDVQGRLMMQTAIYNTNAQLNLSNLQAGTYLLMIGDESVKIIKK